MMKFKIEGEANRYLIAQRGDLASKSYDIEKFHKAWSDEVEKTIAQIGFEPRHVLDIGSGLGLIDIELHRRYETLVTLVDGEEPPLVYKHADPFCSRRVVEQFWDQNEVPLIAWRYLSPEQIKGTVQYGTFDLVLSLRSWCFHYPPEVYRSFVFDHIGPGTRLLIDVRSHHLDWLRELETWFPDPRNRVCVEQGEKFKRMLYTAS